METDPQDGVLSDVETHSIEVSFLLRPWLRHILNARGVRFVESRRLLVSSFAVEADAELVQRLSSLTPYVNR
jgi:hypothetical protein